MDEIHVTLDASPERWDAYVNSRPNATGYHLAAWATVFTKAFGHETRYLAAECGGEIAGILPLVIFNTPFLRRFSVSLPFVNYGGIVADAPEIERALMNAAVAATKAARGEYLEMRHTRRHFPALPSKQHKVAMVLPLEETEEKQWKALDRKIRNQVRKAEKSQLRASCGGLELLDAFYDVFAHNMRDLGTPAYGKPWFHHILATFPENTRIFCVWLGDQPVAASYVFWHGDTIEVPSASSLRRFNSLCTNTMLYWEMLRFAIGRGFRNFDFGRSTPGAGTYEFKRQWGAQPHELTWEYWLASGDEQLPDLSPQNPRVQWAIEVWRHLPLPVTRAVGPLVVRHIP
ncbi:MAG: FemAB family PEP-CTERM system-associated protein [Acidobacteria bacterium]|nr:MAG: FemAB family PEP-CTERM system-associated protein [Acidobacteriota bacterium]